MDYDVSFVGGDVIVVRGEVECFVKEVLADGGVEVFNVEPNGAGALMVLCRFEPVNYRCGVFPLVEVACFCDVAVNTVEDAFADFAYLGFRRVD